MLATDKLTLCPADLLPDSAVSRDDPLLHGCSEVAAQSIRSALTPNEISTKIDSILAVGNRRLAFGDWGALALSTMDLGYASIDSGSCLFRMHAHEREMVHRLKLALPSQGELVAQARERIQARIAARKALQQHRLVV